MLSHGAMIAPLFPYTHYTRIIRTGTSFACVIFEGCHAECGRMCPDELVHLSSLSLGDVGVSYEYQSSVQKKRPNGAGGQIWINLVKL